MGTLFVRSPPTESDRSQPCPCFTRIVDWSSPTLSPRHRGVPERGRSPVAQLDLYFGRRLLRSAGVSTCVEGTGTTSVLLSDRALAQGPSPTGVPTKRSVSPQSLVNYPFAPSPGSKVFGLPRVGVPSQTPVVLGPLLRTSCIHVFLFTPPSSTSRVSRDLDGVLSGWVEVPFVGEGRSHPDLDCLSWGDGAGPSYSEGRCDPRPLNGEVHRSGPEARHSLLFRSVRGRPF